MLYKKKKDFAQTYFFSLSQYILWYCSMYLKGPPHVGQICVPGAGGGGGATLLLNMKRLGMSILLLSRIPAAYPPSM